MSGQARPRRLYTRSEHAGTPPIRTAGCRQKTVWRRITAVALTAMVAWALTGCMTDTQEASPSTHGTGPIALPPVEGVFDYQLGGAYDQVDTGSGPVTIDVVVRDATAQPLPGAYNVCYVNGFQTQPGDAGFWRDHDTLLLHDEAGAPVVDPDWPDEYLLDPSTNEQRAGILDIIGGVIDDCAQDGFDAVEIDNLDTWTRFPQIEKPGAHALASVYVDRAHNLGMAIAQKNAAEIAPIAHHKLGFDFAVAEECGAWDECVAYTDVYGPHVLQIEYPEPLNEKEISFLEICARVDRAPLTIFRDRGLMAAGSPGYLYETC